ncbi:Aerobic respiration control sensor protein ArcB [Pirellulimonas nuda]|uniref:histidine kinase n=1 Tax=Pirellulimonas nuda TaxID=2528009 RepID=A0A518DGZ2_9BACT|nr:PAS domain-containing hybrid sensor histidine kinase/response regulator [Pirellulimonas nuda]QDU90741.1 Aerobic respiration control sensor protein ArcB [Pirellulimonas nuda]
MTLNPLDTEGFPPRWECGTAWRDEPWLGWLHIGADLATWGAYTAIPVLIVLALWRSRALPAPRVLALFAAFILACGTVHLLEAVIFWHPVYRLSGVAKLVTAIVSWATVIAMARLAPRLLTFRSPQALEVEVAERTRELQQATDSLEAAAALRVESTKKLRHNEHRLRTALAAGRMGAWDWNLETDRVLFDDTELEILGLGQESRELSSAEFFEWVHPDDREGLAEVLRRVIDEDGHYDHVFRFTTQAGEERWIAGRGSLLLEPGEPRRMVGVNYDVTAIKQNEIELAEARQRADSASQAKSRFLANTSHEIRTPLTAILGCAESLVRHPDSADSADTARTIKAQGEHLMHLLNDLLDLSKIEAGKLELRLEPTSPAAALTEIESLMRPRATEKGLRLSVELAGPIPRRVTTDPQRLRQVLLNLVSNAIKFTEKGGVTLTAGLDINTDLDDASDDDSPMLRIEVDDTGTGVPADELDSIFKRFHQASSAEAAHLQGTGLGLAISSRLAKMLGGRLTAESTVGVGSRFSLTIPIDPNDIGSPEDSIGPSDLAASRRPTPPAEFPADLKGRVLIAEDTAAVRFILKQLFNDFAGEVEFAEDGQQALDAARRAREAGRPFDLLLMDMQMPVMTGFDAARALRAAGHTTPIIALTASAMAGDRQRCLDAGCDGYLAKPIDWDTMVREVVSRLSR